MSISNSVILTKIIELICAAVFLISVSEVISFIVKTLRAPPPPQEWTMTSDGPIELKFSVIVGYG
jgi:hypothetical protein